MSRLKRLKSIFKRDRHKEIEEMLNASGEVKNQDIIDLCKDIEDMVKEQKQSLEAIGSVGGMVQGSGFNFPTSGTISYPDYKTAQKDASEALKAVFEKAEGWKNLSLEKILDEYESFEDLVKEAKQKDGS